MTTPQEPSSGSEDPDEAAEEHDLLVVVPLSDHHMGTRPEQARIQTFAEELAAAVAAAEAGEYQGDELGGGEYVLFFCGPDEARLVSVLHPLLQREEIGRRARLARLVHDADGEPRREPLRL